MTKRSIAQRLQSRIPGVPRTAREALSSLQALATLRTQGWHRSLRNGAPMSALGEPQPWFSYAAVKWLDRVLSNTVRIFEYGAGSSTAWFASAGRSAEITSIEHDPQWFARLQQPKNGRIIHCPVNATWWDADDDARYVRSIVAGSPWDVVVVDGMGRNACAKAAGSYVSENGLVILDDTDKAESTTAQEELQKQGMGRLDFWGFKAGIGTPACTTVFSRDFNSWLRD